MATISYGHNNSGVQVGVSHGPIYVSQERPEPRPEPLFTVPFPRDPEFVGRGEILGQIHETASIGGARVTLVGLGGVGKTQIAIEYCYQARQKSANMWVFWVHASNAARCEDSLRDIADRAKIARRQDHNTNIFQLFGNWLQDGKIGKWILVLDNVDDDDLLRRPLAAGTGSQVDIQSNTLTQPLLRYLFESSNGSIIITSRNRGVALNLASHRNIIEVQPMNQAEAVDLLQKKLSTPTEHESIVQLAQELEFMPLAIVQAASYITHRSPRCSVLQYLQKIQKGDRDAARVLNEEAGHLYRDWEAKNSILLTWQISFDYIRGTRPSATNLLSLMSFFNWQGITEDVLRVRQNQSRDDNLTLEQPGDSSSEQDTDNESDDDADGDFENNITILCDFSLISVGGDIMSFTMHRLVQLCVRTWLKTHSQLELWKGIFIENLYSQFPTGEYENWERCRSLFPHVKAAVSQRPESPICAQQWATLLYRGACYAQWSGHITEAIEMASRSRKYRLKTFGAEKKETLNSTAMLAVAYQLAGRLEEAEQLNMQVLETRRTKLGADYPDTLASMGNLACTYMSQGRWEEAEQLHGEVIETCKTKLDADHPYVLTSMGNLASTYKNQDRWETAEQLEVQVTEVCKTKLGVDHPDTLTSMANLAWTYINYGRFKEAERLNVQVIEVRKTKFGADHPHTLTSMSSLAWTYVKQGRWEEAERLNVQVMETYKTKFGADHPDTLTTMCTLSNVYGNQRRWEEAERLNVQVMEARKTTLGMNHPDTLKSMVKLALIFRITGRHSAAIGLLRTCVSKQQRILGPAHPDTVSNSDALLAWETEDLPIKG